MLNKNFITWLFFLTRSHIEFGNVTKHLATGTILTVICALMEIVFTNKIILSYNSKLKGMIQRINPFTFVPHSFHEMACPSIDMGQNTTMPLLVVNYVHILFQKSFQLKSSVCFETDFRTKSKPRSTNIKLPILTK